VTSKHSLFEESLHAGTPVVVSPENSAPPAVVIRGREARGVRHHDLPRSGHTLGRPDEGAAAEALAVGVEFARAAQEEPDRAVEAVHSGHVDLGAVGHSKRPGSRDRIRGDVGCAVALLRRGLGRRGAFADLPPSDFDARDPDQAGCEIEIEGLELE
jgi:hypothetical protein